MSYIYLDRKIQDHWLWSDKPYDKARAWIDLLMLAEWTGSEILRKNKVIKRKRGEVHVSLLWLANRWGWSRNKVRRFIKLLETQKMVTLNATTNDTIITIENYSKYQDKRTTNDTTNDTTDEPSANQARTKREPSANHIKERNKKGISKEQVRDKEYIGAKKFTPPTLEEVEAYCFERQNGIDAESFIDYYARQGWVLANGQKVKDWKACVRTWEKREQKRPQSTGRLSWVDDMMKGVQ